MKAFITGVTGQDGHYLARALQDKGYQVYGLVRRSSQPRDIPAGVTVVEGDITDPSVAALIERVAPHEIYHLAAMSHVGESFAIPQATFEMNARGTLNVLEAARKLKCKFYNAASSELFGLSPPPQHELTPFHPRSPYAVSKLAAYWATVNYREAYGLYAVNGILFNHESPRRGEHFVTQKVARYCGWLRTLTWYRHRKVAPLALGNLDAIRDWGHAADFVDGMYRMLQAPAPSDYVLATGVGRTVHELLRVAFGFIGIDDWRPYITLDTTLLRPAEVPELVGDATKARERLGWRPTVEFDDIIKEMIEFEITARTTDMERRRKECAAGGDRLGALHDGGARNAV